MPTPTPTNAPALRRALRCALAVLTAACAAAPGRPAGPAEARAGIDLEGMDAQVAPGDDFFAYANGGWLRRSEIPPDRAGWGTSGILVEQTGRRVAALLAEAAAAGERAGPDARRVGDYYASFLDEAAIEARGLAPLRPALEAIEAIADLAALSRALGGTLRADVDVFNASILHTTNLLGLWVAQDLDDPDRYSPFLLQGGLVLPDRDYYLSPSPRLTRIRERYQPHVAALLRLAGLPHPEESAARIVALETKIALAHAPRVETSDVKKGNNHWTRKELEERAPGLDWAAFLGAAGLDRQPAFVAWHPGAIRGISALVREAPLATWKEWLAFHALERAASVLPRAFVEEQFDFHGRELTGTPQLPERTKRAVAATEAALGEAVGKLYVERHFSAAEKARAEEMARNVVAAFGKRIDALDWMTPETKAHAKAKLATLRVYVGYPDRFRDDTGLEVVRGDAFGNRERASLFQLRRELAKLGQPVDRGEWAMIPSQVNAVNLPAMNSLDFPAAILQPPYFDARRPAAIDYGSIGSVIGHEVSHSFDSEGALFDDRGRLRNWWTEADLAHFEAASERLVKQFDAYRPFPDLAVNGKLTLAENIADVAGLAAAYDAWKLSLHGAPAPEWQGLGGDQQFFLGFAQGWRSKLREAEARKRILTDGHAPPQFRTATVRNLDAWYDAFAVRPGQALFLAPGDRVRIW